MKSVIVDIEQVSQDAGLGDRSLGNLHFAGLLTQRGSGTESQLVSRFLLSRLVVLQISCCTTVYTYFGLVSSKGNCIDVTQNFSQYVSQRF